ncbi:MAG: anti-sigma factor domain-containing protein [Solirubrobacterales bacterium]
MTGARDHRRWRADLAAYLLGSLEPDENEALEQHLEDCQRCRDELRWLQPAIDLLPATVPQLQPPPELRERLLAEVRPRTAASAPGPERRGLLDGLQRLFLRPAVAMTAVALIVAVAAGYALRGGGDGSSTTTISGPADGSVRATLERSGDSGTLMLTGLPQLPPSDVYQAWVQKDRRLVPSSLFAAHRDGSASAAIPRHLEGAETVMVTREPRGGSRQPSSTPIVNVSLRG